MSALVVATMVMAVPAQADTTPSDGINASASAMSGNEKLRRLDIMLMVTGLRCRTTQDDFQADFQAFEARHLVELNLAARALAAEFAAHMTPGEAALMVDRLSVRMANAYGNGHPWLGCHELKLLTQRLAGQDGDAVLIEAASQTLDGDAGPPAPALAIADPVANPASASSSAKAPAAAASAGNSPDAADDDEDDDDQPDDVAPGHVAAGSSPVARPVAIAAPVAPASATPEPPRLAWRENGF